MKTSLVVAALFMTACSCASGGSPPPTLAPSDTAPAPAALTDGWKVLVDFDRLPEMPPIAEHDKVLEQVVGPHRHQRKECASDGPKTIATLQGGIQGAFTNPGAKEVAFLVTTSGCQDPEGQDTDKHRLVIMTDNKVVLDKEITEHLLVAVKDLDADGDNEVLVVSGKKTDPTGSISARLLDTEGGEMQVLFDFGEVVRTQCVEGHGTLQSATIVYRAQGTSMEYRADKRQKPCK